jgi:hypothetical protein
MKMNQYLVKTAYRSSSDTLLTDHCSGVFLTRIRRAALLTVMLGMTVVAATSCSSTGNGFSARLVSPVSAAQQGSYLEDEGRHEPARSPAFSAEKSRFIVREKFRISPGINRYSNIIQCWDKSNRHLACGTLCAETSQRILTIRERRCYPCELTCWGHLAGEQARRLFYLS